MEQVKQLRAVIFWDGGAWAAQCLEHDIGAQAPDLDALQFRLGVAIEVEFQESLERHGEPFGGIDPAPAHYHRMWDEGAGTFTPQNPPKLSGGAGAIGVAMKMAA